MKQSGPDTAPVSGATSGTTRPKSLSARIEAATAPERDRFLDLLRVAAIMIVIFGHWVVRVVIAPEGEPQAEYLLALEPGWQWATLIWQVMPLIFLVGGALNAESWRRAQSDGLTPVAWVRRRARRMLRPTVPLLLTVVLAWMLAEALAPDALLIAPGVALIPLWFVAAYLAVMALTPVTLALHTRGWSLPAIIVAVAVAAAVDMLRLAGVGPVVGTQPLIGLPNFLLIWATVHQLGHMWADDQLPAQAGKQALMVLVGVVAMALLIGVAHWPLTMVPVEGTTLPNNAAPPTVALFALALTQTGLALLARKPLNRALQNPWIWTPVALLGARMLTLFLWHQVAMVVVTNLAVRQGWLPLTGTVDARWWAQQPLWIASFAALLTVLVVVAGRFEAVGDTGKQRDTGGWALTVTGIALVAAGIAGLLWLGVADLPLWPALVFLALCLIGFRALNAPRNG